MSTTPTPPEVPTKALPGAPDFDVDNASDDDYKKHKAILKRRQEVAELSVLLTPAQTLTATAEGGAPIEAPVRGLPEITKLNTETGLPVSLPQIAWDALSEEDAAKFTEYEAADAPKPALV